MQQFDPNAPGLVEGEITSLSVAELPPAPTPPLMANHVINADKDFEVVVEWKIFGPWANLWLGHMGNAKRWDVELFAESIGGGPEETIGSTQVPNVFAGPEPYTFTATITVPAGTLPEGDPGPGPSGLYRLAATVFLDNSSGFPYDSIGYHDGPIVQVESLV